MDGDPEAGRELFATHCAACHGPTGQGRGDVPSLAGVTERLGPESAVRTIREGRDRMPAFGEISREEYLQARRDLEDPG